MKNILIFVGDSFLLNEEFCNYIKREYSNRIGKIDGILFFLDNDKDLFLKINRIYAEYKNILIVTSTSTYPIVSKIVATIFEDILVAKENQLIPSKATKFQADSFLIEGDIKINVIRVDELTKIPNIFIENKEEFAILNIFNISKEEIKEKLYHLSNTYEIKLTCSQVTKEWIRVCAKSEKFGDLAMFVQNAKLLMPNNLIIANNIVEYLIERFGTIKKHIAFAESCTGGLLATLLTKTPGSSKIFKGSLITYANEIKTAWLGVKTKTLNEYGAVSKETVREMLKGTIKVSDSDYALAISGIAGPGGATKNKPVGTVVIGVRNKNEEIIKIVHFNGDRGYIQYQAAMYAIKLLFDLAKDDLF